MHQCPKCGYREGTDWPGILWVLAFTALYVIFIIVPDHVPMSYRFAGLLAFFLFQAGTFWKARREKKNRDEYLKLNLGPAERVKNHLKTDPANSH
jgi:hypothetical protein